MVAALTLQDIGAYRDRLVEVEEPLLFALPVADAAAQSARDRACELSAELIGQLARLERRLEVAPAPVVDPEPEPAPETPPVSPVRLSGVRLPAAAQRVVSGHLKSWPTLRAELRELERGIVEDGYGQSFEAVRKGRVGDPTASRALRLADDRHASELKRVVGAIERALDVTDERVAKAIRAHYLHRLTWNVIAERMQVERQTVYRWHQAFAVSVWQRLQRAN